MCRSAMSVHSPIAAITNTLDGSLSWLRQFEHHGAQRAEVGRHDGQYGA